jgi:hypothetical protein
MSPGAPSGQWGRILLRTSNASFAAQVQSFRLRVRHTAATVVSPGPGRGGRYGSFQLNLEEEGIHHILGRCAHGGSHLPDLGGLYNAIGAYLDRHRQRLLKGAVDPGTFFVKTVRATSADAAFDQTTFYEAWRLTIQRFGIFNPYTGRGAIKGLLPHGPHNVRDVLATHILKQTGSYEQASYAIQDTPDMVAKHYGRFLPQDKAALAAQTLNRVWMAA